MEKKVKINIQFTGLPSFAPEFLQKLYQQWFQTGAKITPKSIKKPGIISRISVLETKALILESYFTANIIDNKLNILFSKVVPLTIESSMITIVSLSGSTNLNVVS